MTDKTHDFLKYLINNEDIYYKIEDAFINKKKCPEIPDIEYKYLNTFYANLLNCELDNSIIEVVINKIKEKYPELYYILDNFVDDKDYISFLTHLREKLNDQLDLDMNDTYKKINYFVLFLKWPKMGYVLK